jgi:GWxTD domain-containing protein
MTKKYYLLLFMFLSTGIVFCQTELGFDFDYARFKYDSNSVYLEFYYSLNSKDMVMNKYENGKMSEAIVHIEMKNSLVDSFFINKDYKIQNIITDNDSLNGQTGLTGVFGFPVPKGKYSLLVKTWDANNPSFSKTIKENIEIEPYDDKFEISDIELASNIKKDNVDAKSLFYKNTYEVIPNPTMLYSSQTPIAFYYAELYNLTDSTEATDFTFQKTLFNSAGVAVYKNSRIIKQIKNSIVEVGTVNLSKHATDSYNLVLSLINNKNKQAFLSSKRFFLYNPGVVDSSLTKNVNTSVLNSSFGIMTLEECERMFLESKYIAAQVEIDKYESLDSLDAKRTFLANFWKNRDTDPSTPQNEYFNDYMKRVDYANEHFHSSYKEGFLSERGRVYLMYGEPSQRDFYPNESDMKPYEIWFYNEIEGGVTFVFGDISGFGRYELLHSTKRGEVKDDNWKKRISTQ